MKILDFQLVHFKEVDSTQTVAKKLIDSNKAEHGTVVIAESQTSGRGRYDRSWYSPSGGLYMTICLKPEIELQRWSLISYVIGISIAECVSSTITSCSPMLKWVNDVLIEGKKVAGILLEMHNDYLVIGVGINIEECEEFEKLHATSLKAEAKSIDRDKLEAALLERIKQNYNLFLEKGFEPIHALWSRRAYGLGKPITIKMRSQEVSGTFIGIDENGLLELLSSGDLKLISAGDVYFGT